MEQRILTRCYRAAVYTATASIEDLAREAGYARPTVEMYLYQRPPSADAARALAAALERREAELGLGAFRGPDVKRTTIVELAQMLRDDYKVNGRRSLRRAETSLDHVLPHFGAAWEKNPDPPDGGEWKGGARAVTVTADRV